MSKIGIYLTRKDFRQCGYEAGRATCAWKAKALPFDSEEQAREFIRRSGMVESTEVPTSDRVTHAYIVQL